MKNPIESRKKVDKAIKLLQERRKLRKHDISGTIIFCFGDDSLVAGMDLKGLKTNADNLIDMMIEELKYSLDDMCEQLKKKYKEVKMKKENITKIYISGPVIDEKEVNYLIMSNKCYPVNIRKLSRNSFISEVEYKDYNDILNIVNTAKSYFGKDITVRRVFKSMKLKDKNQEPKKAFLMQLAMGITGIINKPVKIKVTDTNASKWAVELTQMWAKELGNPVKFKEKGINPVIDIDPKGDIVFHITRSGNQIITFFKQNIDDLVDNEKASK